MEYEKCYVFRPEDDTRPSKRRRTEPQGLQASWPVRREAYHAAWALQQGRIAAALNELNSATTLEISKFLDELIHTPPKSRIPTAIILGGPDATSHVAVTSQLANGHGAAGRRLYASLSLSSGPNLKAILKTLIQKATARHEVTDDDEDELPNASRKGPRLLNYDLQILANFVRDYDVKQVIVAVEDTEAFDSNLLSELVELMGYWLDRIPFVCLLSIATSVEFLQQRLSRGAVRCLEGRLFDVAPSVEELQRVFGAVVDTPTPLRIGSSLASITIDRQNDYIQSIVSFVDAVRYAYMSHYYANALSIFLVPDITHESIPRDHFEALRNLDSFRAFAQQLLDERNVEQLQRLLDVDASLYDLAKEKIQYGQQKMTDVVSAIDVVRTIQEALPNVQISKKSSLYIQAMSSKLHSSASIRSLLLTIRRLPSDTALGLMRALCALNLGEWLSTSSTTSDILQELEALLSNQTDTTQPLRSSDDLSHATNRTTITAKKIELTKQKSTLCAQDAAYTTLLRRLTDALETFFTATLIDPKTLLFHELFLYDLKSPHRDVFAPRPRHAVERALAAPHDYLDCDCCGPAPGEGDDEATLSASQPATAVLYQLYLESGSLINARDLWTAFQAVMGEEQAEEQHTMALFQRGLAELKYLGMVKGTRKRVDHVAKVAWRGL